MFVDETRDAGNEPDDSASPSEAERPEDSGESREKSEESEYVKVPKAEFAAWKDNAERLNQLERQFAERPEPSPAAPQAGAEPEDEDYWRGVEYWASDRYNEKGEFVKGDPVARATLAGRTAEQKRAERDSKLIGAVSSLLELSDIEDRTERAEVKKLMLSGRDIRSAQNEVRSRKLEAENARLAAENKRLAANRDPNVIRTHDREVFSDELKSKTKMTESQFDARQAMLRKQGKHSQAMKEQGMLANDDIEMEWGR